MASNGFKSYRYMPDGELIAGEWLEQFSDYVDGVKLISDMVVTSMLDEGADAYAPALNKYQQRTMLRFLRSVSDLTGNCICDCIDSYANRQTKQK